MAEASETSPTYDYAGLERLHLISLSKISTEGILPLRRLGKLKHIMLARCPNVCETGLHVRSLHHVCCCAWLLWPRT